MTDSPKTAENLKALRKRTGLSVRSFAEKIGRVASSYQHYESTYKKRLLPAELVDDMEPVLREHGIPEADILRLRGIDAGHPFHEKERVETQNSLNVQPTIIPLSHQAKDLPVLGAARGGNMEAGVFADNGNFFEMIARPASLAGVKDAYAVYVVDESMEPRYFSGELVHVHPHKPPQPGAFVVVQTDDGETTDYLIKRLVRRKGGKVTFEQYNPTKKFDLPLAHIKAMHTIVGAATPA